jgi:hypothetical protein
MATEGDGTPLDTTAAFTDTSVLFDYALDGRAPAETLFLDTPAVSKVTSKRGRNEFEAVRERRVAIHREFRGHLPGDLEEFDPEGLSELTGNDLGYLTDLFNELLEIEDDAEALRRLNEKKRQLNTAHRELFSGTNPAVEVVEVGTIDIQLRDALALEIDNMDDVRLLCDVVEWTRDGGTGVFLTSDAKDFLPEQDDTGQADTDDGAEDDAPEADEGGGLPSSLTDFMSDDETSKTERINEQIRGRYSDEAKVDIMRTEAFLEQL